MKYTGFAAVRIQPLHEGHTRIINKMIADCETVIIGVGSTNRSRERTNPWTFEERKQMLINVYGNRLKIVPLQDIGTAQGSNDWVDYTLSKIKKLGLPEPTSYWTGSMQDGMWYKDRFYNSVFDSKPKDSQYTSDSYLRRLHIIDRENNHTPAATEIRGFLELRTDLWSRYTPGVNYDLIKDTYPDEFRVRLED